MPHAQVEARWLRPPFVSFSPKKDMLNGKGAAWRGSPACYACGGIVPAASLPGAMANYNAASARLAPPSLASCLHMSARMLLVRGCEHVHPLPARGHSLGSIAHVRRLRQITGWLSFPKATAEGALDMCQSAACLLHKLILIMPTL